jgi:hypothetical protein
MATINFHPAPGFGELMPGAFVVPQNPFRPASYVPSIGELLPGTFTVPENPIIRELSGQSSLRPGSNGSTRTISMEGIGSCGCISGMCGCDDGMGDLGFIDPITGGAAVLGGLLILWLLSLPGGKDYRYDRIKARADYEKRLSEIRSSHRAYRRGARAVGRGTRAAASKTAEWAQAAGEKIAEVGKRPASRPAHIYS